MVSTVLYNSKNDNEITENSFWTHAHLDVLCICLWRWSSTIGDDDPGGLEAPRRASSTKAVDVGFSHVLLGNVKVWGAHSAIFQLDLATE